MTRGQKIARAKAIEAANKKRILKICQEMPDTSGIYFWARKDENGIKHAYIGQAKHLLSRNAEHLSGYQYIDLSIKSHGLYDTEKNPTGYKLHFEECPEEELDARERHCILLYAQMGYQLKNRDTGGGKGKAEIGERRPAKGYRDGVRQGRREMAREIRGIIEKHLEIKIKPEKEKNKVSRHMLEKFWEILEEANRNDERFDHD